MSRFNYGRAFDDMASKLTAIGWLYRQACELLLNELAIKGADYRNLLDKKIGWKSKHLQIALKSRIRENDRLALIVSAEGLDKRLTRLCEALGLIRTPKESANWTVSDPYLRSH